MVQFSEIATIRDAELLDSPLSVGFLRSPSFFNEESFCIETILREPPCQIPIPRQNKTVSDILTMLDRRETPSAPQRETRS
jgi:hypothetical protein